MNAVIEAGNLFSRSAPLQGQEGQGREVPHERREFEDFFLSSGWPRELKIRAPRSRQRRALMELLRAVGEYRGLFRKFVKRGVPAAILAELLRTRVSAATSARLSTRTRRRQA